MARRILLIDDSREVAEAVGAALEARGCEVTVATSCSRALSFFIDREYDTIICDYDLGDGYGTRLIDGYTGTAETILFSGLDRTKEIAAECATRKPDRQVSKTHLSDLIESVAGG